MRSCLQLPLISLDWRPSYIADQRVSRGGETDVFGDDWRRAMRLCVPVSDPDFWSISVVREALTNVLSFATDDYWTFSFSKREPTRGQLMLEGAGGSTPPPARLR